MPAIELSICKQFGMGIFCGERDANSCGDDQSDDHACVGEGLPIHVHYEAPAGCDAPLMLGGDVANVVA